MVKLHIVLVRCSELAGDAAAGWMTPGLKTLTDSANSGHVFVYEACFGMSVQLVNPLRRREKWGTTLEKIPNLGYEAGGYLHHLRKRYSLLPTIGADEAFGDTTFFLQSQLEEHVDLQVCPFSCKSCHAIRPIEVCAQLRQRAIDHGYVGLGSSYRDRVLRSGDVCNQQATRWTWREAAAPRG